MTTQDLAKTIAESGLSLDNIRRAVADGYGAIAKAANTSYEVWNGREGAVADVPSYGATLMVNWAVHDQSCEEWYPTEKAAMAALHAVAASHGRTVVGRTVNLTSHNCHESIARVRVISPDS